MQRLKAVKEQMVDLSDHRSVSDESTRLIGLAKKLEGTI